MGGSRAPIVGNRRDRRWRVKACVIGVLIAFASVELGARSSASEAATPVRTLAERIAALCPRSVPELAEEARGGEVVPGKRAGARMPALPTGAAPRIPHSWRIRHASLFRTEPPRPRPGPLLAPASRSRPCGEPFRLLFLAEEDPCASLVLAEDTPSERFARGILTTVARYRYAPQPILSASSDSGTILLGLTWRR